MKNEHTKKKTARMTLRTGLIAAAAAVLLAGSALAVAAGTGFFQELFGNNGTGHEAYTVEKTDPDGNVVSEESYPAVERAEVDEEAAQALVGDYVAAVETSVSIGDYTFTLEEVVMDENGIGAATVTVENPNGFPDEVQPEWYGFGIDTGSGVGMDFTSFLLEESSTETCRRYACYFTPFEKLDGAELQLVASVYTDLGDNTADIDEGYISIPASAAVPASAFAGGGMTASVSAVGMEIAWPGSGTAASGEEEDVQGYDFITHEIILRYEDGSEYAAKSGEQNVYNLVLESGDLGTYTWCAFNRLADVDSIAEIEVGGVCYRSDGGAESVSYTLTPAA